MADEFDRTDGLEPESTQEAAPEHDTVAPSVPAEESGLAGAQPAEFAGMFSRLLDGPAGLDADVASIAASLDAEAGTGATAVLPAVNGELPPPTPIDLGPERRTSGWAWVLGLLGVLAVGAVGWAIWYYFLSPVTVPRVVGKDVGQAAQALNDANVRLGRTSEEPTSAAPPGTVIAQTPANGTEVDRDTEVALVIAAPPTTMQVPDVTGVKAEDAQKALAAEELGATIVETYDSAAAAGFVISQLPTAGAELPPGSLVALAVSKGPSPSSSTVPDLRGISTEEAQKVLAALDLVPAAYKSNDASVPAGQIATQTPAPGTRVNARSTVMYLVSDGRALAPVTVPSVATMLQKTATDKIKSVGLVPKVRKVASGSVPAGSVIMQMPLSGAQVGKGTTVGLLVSRGASDLLAVPSVEGTDQAAAAKSLTSAGFKAIMLPSPLATGTPGAVLAQWPAATTTWPEYLPVIAIYRQQ